MTAEQKILNWLKSLAGRKALIESGNEAEKAVEKLQQDESRLTEKLKEEITI